MKLNVPKTKLILFNPCKSKDFMPEFKIYDKRIYLVEQVKLLGVVISSNSSLTGEDISSLERLQKTALHIILSDQYTSYSTALKQTGLEKWSDRRSKICIKFAKRAQKHSKFSNWFKPNPKWNKRLQQPKFRPVVFKKQRFKTSPLSYLTSLLNNQWDDRKQLRQWIIVVQEFSY